jgi:hypothetical protein
MRSRSDYIFSNHGVRLVSASSSSTTAASAAAAGDHTRHIWSSWRCWYRWLYRLCCCSGGLRFAPSHNLHRRPVASWWSWFHHTDHASQRQCDDSPVPDSEERTSRGAEGLTSEYLKAQTQRHSRPIVPRRNNMSSKVGQDSNYVAHRVEVAISSRESEIRVRKLKRIAVLACVVGFLLVAAFIVL